MRLAFGKRDGRMDIVPDEYLRPCCLARNILIRKYGSFGNFVNLGRCPCASDKCHKVNLRNLILRRLQSV